MTRPHEWHLHGREILHRQRKTLLEHEVVRINVRTNQFLRPHRKRRLPTFNCSQSSFGSEPGTLDGVLGYVYGISGSLWRSLAAPLGVGCSLGYSYLFSTCGKGQVKDETDQ